MIIGIDPGKSGAICFMLNNGEIIKIIKLSETEHDIRELWHDELSKSKESWFAYIEKLHSIRPAGKVPNFNLGNSFGFVRGLLVAWNIPFELILPQKWQQAMGCMSKGDKNITKAKAQQLFPDIKITHNIADALLIAEYGRRTRTK
jgi:hypothetical protein